MTRTMNASIKAAFTAATLRPFILTEFEFPAVTMRLWSGIGILTWNGDDYTGAGRLLQIRPAEETDGLDANGAVFELSGVPSDLISAGLTAEYQGRPCRIYVGVLDGGNNIIADPVNIFTGLMDVMSLDDDPEFPVISLTAESELVVLNKARDRRYTHEDQQIDFPGDLGLEFVPSLQDKEINWGKS